MAGNITTSTGKAFVVGTMSTEALTALFDLRWMLVLIVVLIVADRQHGDGYGWLHPCRRKQGGRTGTELNGNFP